MGSRRTTVTLLINNLSFGGAYSCVVLGQALQPYFDVQMIGSTFGDNMWSGLGELNFDIRQFPGSHFPKYLGTTREILAQIRGDITIAHQFRFPSFGIGLLHRMKTGSPCAVYVDDDDLALTMPGRSNSIVRRLRTPTGDIPTRLLFKLRNRADSILCGSEYYGRQFGGIVVPLGRDPGAYDHLQHDRQSVRSSLGIAPELKVVGFIGNPRSHVGFDDLVEALEILDDPNVLLLIAPSGSLSEYGRSVMKNSAVKSLVLEDESSDRVPGFLAASDLVVVPQRNNPVSRGQISARLVDAMAMQKPIVCTRVADNETLLENGALFVNERDPKDMSEAIRHIFNNPGEAEEIAIIARQKFLEKLSLDAMRKTLLPAVEQLLR